MVVVTHSEGAEALMAQSIAACEARSRRALEVCDLLETLADDLPRRQAPVWRETQRQCKSVLRPHFVFLVESVFPLLLQRTQDDADHENMLRRLMRDNADQLHSLDDLDDLISEAFESNAFDRDGEVLGFALRGFFEPLRHTLNWELDVLWPLSGRLLTAEDAQGLGSRTAADPTIH